MCIYCKLFIYCKICKILDLNLLYIVCLKQKSLSCIHVARPADGDYEQAKRVVWFCGFVIEE